MPVRSPAHTAHGQITQYNLITTLLNINSESLNDAVSISVEKEAARLYLIP